MYKVSIISPYNSIAMQKMTLPLINLAYNIAIDKEYVPGADIYYHVPYHTLVNLKSDNAKHVMLYTHNNPPDKDNLIDACGRADAIVCMSYKGASELMDLGISENKLVVIYAGITPQKPRAIIQHDKLMVGVVCFEQPNGRKRSHILIDLAWMLDNSKFNFVIAGGGMQNTCNMMINTGASVQYYENLSDEEMNELYNALDVLLVTGYIEGGPLTVLEALSAGVPVISSDVGYAHDLLPKECIYHTVEELIDKLNNFVPHIDHALQAEVNEQTPKRYTDRHGELFERLLKGEDYADLCIHGQRTRAGGGSFDVGKPESDLSTMWSGYAPETTTLPGELERPTSPS
jgi:glycosyltransferase involved in cell wall biosynthesis